ncbi:MAG TPA: hypothetical protein VM118_00620, partial [Acidobacteriota bacterium]|nr:hypothetical protein [Acidobacteriota bacterium]
SRREDMSDTTEARSVRAITEDRINFSRSTRVEWMVRVPINTDAEDLLLPEYWKHVSAAKKFKVGDDIIAKSEDGTWRAHYEIRDVGPLHATLALLVPGADGVYRYAKSRSLTSADERHEVTWKGPAHRWVIRRVSDGETIKHGFDARETAEAWMNTEMHAEAAA